MKYQMVYVVSLLFFILNSCNDNSNELPISNTVSSISMQDDTLLNASEFDLNLTQFIYKIDSAANKDGTAFKLFLANQEFFYSLSPEQTDTLYDALINSMNNYLDTKLPFIEDKYLDKNYNVKESYEKELLSKGFRSQFDGEGGFFPVVDQKIMFQYFNNRVTSALQEFISFFSFNDEFVAFDGGLVLTPQEIAARILIYDWHLETHKNFSRSTILLKLYAQELYFVMFGLDNTPAFSYSNNIMEEANKDALRILAKKGTPYTQEFINNYINALEENEWHYIENGYNLYYYGVEQARMKIMKNN